MTPSFRERLREILSAVENNGSYDPFKDLPSDNNGITVDRAFTEILSLVRGIVSKVYKGRYPELGDAPIEVMHFAKAILNEIGDGDATRKHDGGL